MNIIKLCARIDYFYKLANECYLESFAGSGEEWLNTSLRISQDPEFANKYLADQAVRQKRYREKAKEDPEFAAQLKELSARLTAQKKEDIASGSLQGLMVKLRQRLADNKKDFKKQLENYKNLLTVNPKDLKAQGKLQKAEEKFTKFENDLPIVNQLRDQVNDYLDNYISFGSTPNKVSQLQNILHKKDNYLSSLSSDPETPFYKVIIEIFNKIQQEYDSLRGF